MISFLLWFLNFLNIKFEIYCRNKIKMRWYILLVVSRSHSRALRIAANTRRMISFHKTAPFVNKWKKGSRWASFRISDMFCVITTQTFTLRQKAQRNRFHVKTCTCGTCTYPSYSWCPQWLFSSCFLLSQKWTFMALIISPKKWVVNKKFAGKEKSWQNTEKNLRFCYRILQSSCNFYHR